MKKSTRLTLTLLGAIFLSSAFGSGEYNNQQLMVNPFMEKDYKGWSLFYPWRNNGEQHALVFDFATDGPTGFFVAKQETLNIKTTGKHVEDPGFDPSTATLTALKFNGIFLQKAAEDNATHKLNAKFYIEFELVTSSGSYRAKSVHIGNPWSLENGVRLEVNTDYEWLSSDGFLGYPFSEGGLVLADIKSIEVKYVMEVINNNIGGSGTVFTTMDNASIEYSVTVP